MRKTTVMLVNIRSVHRTDTYISTKDALIKYIKMRLFYQKKMKEAASLADNKNG